MPWVQPLKKKKRRQKTLTWELPGGSAGVVGARAWVSAGGRFDPGPRKFHIPWPQQKKKKKKDPNSLKAFRERFLKTG